MHLVLVRHGETEENVKCISQGHTHGTLTERGYEQIRAAAAMLQTREFDAAYTSDLRRCTETARIIGEANPSLTFITTDRIREKNQGAFQGLAHKDIPWHTLPGTWFTRRPENGESLEDLYNRAQKFLTELRATHAGKKVILVTHGGFIRVIRAIAENKTEDELSEILKSTPVTNASISEIFFHPDGIAKVLTWNRTL